MNLITMLACGIFIGGLFGFWLGWSRRGVAEIKWLWNNGYSRFSKNTWKVGSEYTPSEFRHLAQKTIKDGEFEKTLSDEQWSVVKEDLDKINEFKRLRKLARDISERMKGPQP